MIPQTYGIRVDATDKNGTQVQSSISSSVHVDVGYNATQEWGCWRSRKDVFEIQSYQPRHHERKKTQRLPTTNENETYTVSKKITTRSYYIRIHLSQRNLNRLYAHIRNLRHTYTQHSTFMRLRRLGRTILSPLRVGLSTNLEMCIDIGALMRLRMASRALRSASTELMCTVQSVPPCQPKV